MSGSPGQMADLDTGQFTLVTDSMWTGTELFQLESGKSLVTGNKFRNRETVLHFSKSEKGLLTKVKQQSWIQGVHRTVRGCLSRNDSREVTAVTEAFDTAC